MNRRGFLGSLVAAVGAYFGVKAVGREERATEIEMRDNIIVNNDARGITYTYREKLMVRDIEQVRTWAVDRYGAQTITITNL